MIQQQGNPHGELGLVTQRDRGFWQDQSGPPTDPQAGNIPGGRRDILRTADFDNRSLDDVIDIPLFGWHCAITVAKKLLRARLRWLLKNMPI